MYNDIDMILELNYYESIRVDAIRYGIVLAEKMGAV